uniref:glutathione transferase n=1 Tax=Equus asinus asinus TaxID=83772 RepID=A0A8C4PHH0_EQUAS
MVGKPRLHYFNARGRMELIVWLLAAARVKVPSEFVIRKRDGGLMSQQVLVVEIDGMELVQSRAILNYIAAKHNLYGKDIKERALIDMYVEGMADLNEVFITQIKGSTTNRYFPTFEKVLKSHRQDYLVGNRLSRADIHLVELLYLVEELDPNLLTNFPLLKALKARISNQPTVKKFLQPGSERKPPMDKKCYEKGMKIFHVKQRAQAPSTGRTDLLKFSNSGTLDLHVDPDYCETN